MKLSIFTLLMFCSSWLMADIAPSDTIWKKKKNGERYFEIYNGEIDSLPSQKTIPYFEIGFNHWLGSVPEAYKLRAISSRYLVLGFTRRFKVGEGPFGVQTGIEGVWNNYRFDSNEYLVSTPDGHTFSNNTFKLRRNKLTNVSLTVPILLQKQYREENTYTWQWAAGVYGGYTIASYTKIKYTDNNRNKQKNKGHDDFHVRRLRYGLMGLVGYKYVSFVARFDLGKQFKKNTLPSFNTVSVGFRIQP